MLNDIKMYGTKGWRKLGGSYERLQETWFCNPDSHPTTEECKSVEKSLEVRGR